MPSCSTARSGRRNPGQGADARSNWIWGAFKMPGRTLRELHALWLARGQRDEYVGTLVNAWIARGWDGTGRPCRRGLRRRRNVQGYREAIALLERRGHGAGGRRRGRQHGRDASLTGEADRMGARAHQAVRAARAAARGPRVPRGRAAGPAAVADEGGHRRGARIAAPPRWLAALPGVRATSRESLLVADRRPRVVDPGGTPDRVDAAHTPV